MRKAPAVYLNGITGLMVLIVLAGCARHATQESDPARADASSGSQLDADQVFDQADTAPGDGLSALEIERLGLGDHWNTLDRNGDGRVSRREFRQRFNDPAIQRQLQARASATPEQTVSDAWRLPPEPPSQRWQRTDMSVTPTTLSAPSAAAWGVVPSLDADEQPTSAELDVSAGENDGVESTSP